MAKVQVKQWVIFLVVATWLLTTLSACGGSRKMPVAAQGVTHTNPNELWGTWACQHGDKVYVHTFSRRIDASGVEVVSDESSDALGGSTHTYIVDRKIHKKETISRTSPLGIFGEILAGAGVAPDWSYIATSKLRTQEGHKILRVVQWNPGKRQYGYFTDYVVKNGNLYIQYYRDYRDRQREWENVDNIKRASEKPHETKCVRER